MEKKRVRSLFLAIGILIFALAVSFAASGRVIDACFGYLFMMLLVSIPALAQLTNDFESDKLSAVRLARLATVATLSVALCASWAVSGFLIAWSSKFVRSPFLDMMLHFLSMLCFAVGFACSWATLVAREGSRFNEDLEEALRKTFYLLPPVVPFVFMFYAYWRLRRTPRAAS